MRPGPERDMVLVALWSEPELTLADMGRRLGLRSPGYVKDMARRLGLPNRRRGRRPALSSDVIAEVIRREDVGDARGMFENGRSIPWIAEYLGWHPDEVRKVVSTCRRRVSASSFPISSLVGCQHV